MTQCLHWVWIHDWRSDKQPYCTIWSWPLASLGADSLTRGATFQKSHHVTTANKIRFGDKVNPSPALWTFFLMHDGVQREAAVIYLLGFFGGFFYMCVFLFCLQETEENKCRKSLQAWRRFLKAHFARIINFLRCSGAVPLIIVWHFIGGLLLCYISLLHAVHSLHPRGDSTWSQRRNSVLCHSRLWKAEAIGGNGRSLCGCDSYLCAVRLIEQALASRC